MEPQDKAVSIRAWSTGDLLLESYLYAPGPPGATPPHTHDEYQFCLSLNFPGENRYRGANVPIPERSLSIVHPGEAHSSRDLASRPYETAFRLIYLPIAYLQQVRKELTGERTHATEEPFFRECVLDGTPFTRLLAAHTAREHGASRLEEQTLFLRAFSALLIQEGQATPPAAASRRRERAAVRRAREYLDARFDRNVALDELAGVAGLTPVYLCRVFQQEVGLPPHAYQIQRRVMRAKHLLLRGVSPSEVAIAVGFFDQSHFGGYFKRLTGVTPRCYFGTAR